MSKYIQRLEKLDDLLKQGVDTFREELPNLPPDAPFEKMTYDQIKYLRKELESGSEQRKESAQRTLDYLHTVIQDEIKCMNAPPEPKKTSDNSDAMGPGHDWNIYC